jgi:hypothetical protein
MTIAEHLRPPAEGRTPQSQRQFHLPAHAHCSTLEGWQHQHWIPWVSSDRTPEPSPSRSPRLSRFAHAHNQMGTALHLYYWHTGGLAVRLNVVRPPLAQVHPCVLRQS